MHSDIAELKQFVHAQAQCWDHHMRIIGECFTELLTTRMMEPMFKTVGELVLDTTSEVQAARATIQDLIAQGTETLQSRVGGSPGTVSNTITSRIMTNLYFI